MAAIVFSPEKETGRIYKIVPPTTHVRSDKIGSAFRRIKSLPTTVITISADFTPNLSGNANRW